MALDPVFIFLFKMEITGAAIATMLSNVAATVFFLLFLFKIRKNTTIAPSPKYFTVCSDIPLEVLTVGLPSFVMTLMSTVSNLTLNKLISGYSNEAVAGMGIAKKIDLMAFAISQGMTQGTLPLIGYNYSSGNHKRMLSALKVLYQRFNYRRIRAKLSADRLYRLSCYGTEFPCYYDISGNRKENAAADSLAFAKRWLRYSADVSV